jgi:GH24 family phage-related lysozyme (muramidase)
MGARTADQVRSDLQAIGVDEQAAATLSVGAGLRGAQAQNFAQVHASDVSLTEQQQHELLNLADQNAQQAVRTNVHVPLNQNQYDALVSFAYNVGPGAFNNGTLLRLLNNGDYNGAAGQFERWSRSNGEIVEGFVSRRAAELRQFQSP